MNKNDVGGLFFGLIEKQPIVVLFRVIDAVLTVASFMRIGIFIYRKNNVVRFDLLVMPTNSIDRTFTTVLCIFCIECFCYSQWSLCSLIEVNINELSPSGEC